MKSDYIYSILICLCSVLCSNDHPEQLVVFLKACREGDLNLLHDLLQQGVDPNFRDNDGSTPLIQAVKFGFVDIVHDLLKADADTNVFDSTGWIALHYACKNGLLVGVEMLVDWGADFKEETLQGETCHSLAKSGGNEAVIKFIDNLEAKQYNHRHPNEESVSFEPQSKRDELFHAARHNDVKSLGLLMDQGIDPNVEDENGWTALTVAAYSGQIDSITYLVNRGANINKAERDGWTPLSFAAYRVITANTMMLNLIISFNRANFKSFSQS